MTLPGKKLFENFLLIINGENKGVIVGTSGKNFWGFSKKLSYNKGENEGVNEPPFSKNF